MTAKAARSIADNVHPMDNYGWKLFVRGRVRESAVPFEKALEDLLETIEESAAEGYYEIYLNRKIPDLTQLQSHLEQLGFNVSPRHYLSEDPTEEYISISWK